MKIGFLLQFHGDFSFLSDVFFFFHMSLGGRGHSFRILCNISSPWVSILVGHKKGCISKF